jgi:DNA-binding NarL/FixJ family response regulator
MNPNARLRKSATATELRVLIVDDHPFMRIGLTESISREPGLCVCGNAETAEAALQAVERLGPDVVVSDLNLPGRGGLELIKDIASVRPGLPVIILSMHDEAIYAERCLRAGARGYLMKSEGPEKLAAAIRNVLAGGIHVSPKIAERIVATFTGLRDAANDSPVGQLTDREFEVLRLIGLGSSTDEIADRLHVSPKTVETHRVHIKSKLAIGSLAELISYAARWTSAG